MEAKPFPREKICGGGVAGRVVRELGSLGVDLGSIPHAPVTGFSVFYEQRHYFCPFTGQDGLVVRRSVFDDHLLAVAESLGVEVRFGARVAGAYRERNGVVLVDSEGNLFRARTLVCADGVNGSSRTWFGLPPARGKVLLLQADYMPGNTEAAQGALAIDFSPIAMGEKGYVWFFPSVDEEGERIVNAGVMGTSCERGSADRMKRVFETVLDAHPEYAPATGTPRLRPYPERIFSFRQAFSADRVLFVGEQLGVDPMTGEGLGVCADSGRAAAEEIAAAARCGDFSFNGYKTRLLRSDLLPLWMAGRAFSLLQTPRRFSALLAFATEESTHDPDCFLNQYARAFSGTQPPRTLYSGRGISAVARGIARRARETARNSG
jgi:menaquinone-9 beta-reductase